MYTWNIALWCVGLFLLSDNFRTYDSSGAWLLAALRCAARGQAKPPPRAGFFVRMILEQQQFSRKHLTIGILESENSRVPSRFHSATNGDSLRVFLQICPRNSRLVGLSDFLLRRKIIHSLQVVNGSSPPTLVLGIYSLLSTSSNCIVEK